MPDVEWLVSVWLLDDTVCVPLAVDPWEEVGVGDETRVVGVVGVVGVGEGDCGVVDGTGGGDVDGVVVGGEPDPLPAMVKGKEKLGSSGESES